MILRFVYILAWINNTAWPSHSAPIYYFYYFCLVQCVKKRKKWLRKIRAFLISRPAQTHEIFDAAAAAAAKSLQSCPTLCDPIDGSPPGFPVPGILQARTLEWAAISSSNAWKVKSESEVAQSCPTLHDPMDCSSPGSSAHGILQARVLEWVAIAFSEISDTQTLFYSIR